MTIGVALSNPKSDIRMEGLPGYGQAFLFVTKVSSETRPFKYTPAFVLVRRRLSA